MYKRGQNYLQVRHPSHRGDVRRPKIARPPSTIALSTSSTSPSTIVWLLFCLTRGLSHLGLEAYGVPAGKDGSSMTSEACLKKA